MEALAANNFRAWQHERDSADHMRSKYLKAMELLLEVVHYVPAYFRDKLGFDTEIERLKQ